MERSPSRKRVPHLLLAFILMVKRKEAKLLSVQLLKEHNGQLKGTEKSPRHTDISQYPTMGPYVRSNFYFQLSFLLAQRKSTILRLCIKLHCLVNSPNSPFLQALKGRPTTPTFHDGTHGFIDFRSLLFIQRIETLNAQSVCTLKIFQGPDRL